MKNTQRWRWEIGQPCMIMMNTDITSIKFLLGSVFVQPIHTQWLAPIIGGHDRMRCLSGLGSWQQGLQSANQSSRCGNYVSRQPANGSRPLVVAEHTKLTAHWKIHRHQDKDNSMRKYNYFAYKKMVFKLLFVIFTTKWLNVIKVHQTKFRYHWSATYKNSMKSQHRSGS